MKKIIVLALLALGLLWGSSVCLAGIPCTEIGLGGIKIGDNINKVYSIKIAIEKPPLI